MSHEGKLKVVINKPDVYKLDENGIVYVDDEIVPEGMEALAREGADACPQNALKLVTA